MSYRERKYRIWLGSSRKSNADFRGFVSKDIIMRIRDGKTWVKRYLEKADHNLDFAVFVTELHKTMIKERFPNQTFYDWITVAYYYAVYHAALALIANLDFKSKSHLATLCGIINYYYHKRRGLERRHVEILGKIEKDNIEQFLETQGLRERASYGVSLRFEERLARMARTDAVEFINRVKEILEE